MEDIRLNKKLPANYSMLNERAGSKATEPTLNCASSHDKSSLQRLTSKIFVPASNQSRSTPNETSSCTSQKADISKNRRSFRIFVNVDFDTGLKIDILFECTIFSSTLARDLIFSIVKRLNSYIYCFNAIGKSEG